MGSYSPVQSYGCHWVNAGEYGCDGEEIVEAAVNQTKVPVVVDGIGKVDHRVERWHGGLGKGQVHLQRKDRINILQGTLVYTIWRF